MNYANRFTSKSAAKQNLMDYIYRDVVYMEKNKYKSKLIDDQDPRMTVAESLAKLKKLYNITDELIETEYPLIVEKKSKLSSNQRTLIKFFVLVDKYKDVVPPCPLTPPQTPEPDNIQS